MDREYRIWIVYVVKDNDNEELHAQVYVIECDDINLAYSIGMNKFINKIIDKCVIIKSVEVDDVTERYRLYN